MLFGTAPLVQPSSTKGTNSGHGILIIVIFLLANLSFLPYASDLIVAVVPITPMTLFVVIFKAYFTTGSITPIIGTLYFFFKYSSATEDTVLQAIIITLQL